MAPVCHRRSFGLINERKSRSPRVARVVGLRISRLWSGSAQTTDIRFRGIHKGNILRVGPIAHRHLGIGWRRIALLRIDDLDIIGIQAIHDIDPSAKGPRQGIAMDASRPNVFGDVPRREIDDGIRAGRSKSLVSTKAVFGLVRGVGAAEVTLSREGGSVSLRKRRFTSVSQGSASNLGASLGSLTGPGSTLVEPKGARPQRDCARGRLSP